MLPYGMKLKNTLKVHNIFHDLLNKVSETISKLPDYKSLKGDPETLKLICCLVENEMSKNTSKIDKKDLVICIVESVFGDLTENEKTNLDTQIQFLHNNGQIKKEKFYKIVGFYLFDYIKRRFL